MKHITKWLLILMTLLSTSIVAQNLIDPPKEEDQANKASKEEKGILSSMILIYTKTRDGVKYAYDEIQYWKNMKRTYDKMEDWFSRNKAKMQQAGNTFVLLTTEKGDVLSKFKKTEEFFDQIEDIAFKETREFDRNLASFEKSYDKMVEHERIRGRMIPTTSDVLNKVSTLFSPESSTVIIDDNMSENERAIALARQKEENELAQKRSEIKESSIYNVSKYVASSAMAKSEVYYGWSLTSLGGVENIADKYKNYKGINQKEMQTAWYGIEQVNANNFRLRHSQEELKVYIAMLGLNTWQLSDQRGVEIYNERLNKEKEKELVLLQARERRAFRDKYGYDRPSSR
jgi:hypothetical protein